MAVYPFLSGERDALGGMLRSLSTLVFPRETDLIHMIVPTLIPKRVQDIV